MSDIQISEDDVYDQLCHLNVNKSPGPDGWHSGFFKEAAAELVKPLTVQKSLDTSTLPNMWKIADIVPASI